MGIRDRPNAAATPGAISEASRTRARHDNCRTRHVPKQPHDSRCPASRRPAMRVLNATRRATAQGPPVRGSTTRRAAVASSVPGTATASRPALGRPKSDMDLRVAAGSRNFATAATTKMTASTVAEMVAGPGLAWPSVAEGDGDAGPGGPPLAQPAAVGRPARPPPPQPPPLLPPPRQYRCSARLGLGCPRRHRCGRGSNGTHHRQSPRVSRQPPQPKHRRQLLGIPRWVLHF